MVPMRKAVARSQTCLCTRVHTDEKPYKCLQCMRSATLIRHQAAHTYASRYFSMRRLAVAQTLLHIREVTWKRNHISGLM